MKNLAIAILLLSTLSSGLRAQEEAAPAAESEGAKLSDDANRVLTGDVALKIARDAAAIGGLLDLNMVERADAGVKKPIMSRGRGAAPTECKGGKWKEAKAGIAAVEVFLQDSSLFIRRLNEAVQKPYAGNDIFSQRGSADLQKIMALHAAGARRIRQTLDQMMKAKEKPDLCDLSATLAALGRPTMFLAGFGTRPLTDDEVRKIDQAEMEAMARAGAQNDELRKQQEAAKQKGASELEDYLKK